MNKFLKYLGIAVLVLVVLAVLFSFLGQKASNADKERLSKLPTDSAQYYEAEGSFIGFCSSELYKEIEKNFTYDITCQSDHSEEEFQIVAQLASEYFGCKVTTLPPVAGQQRKNIMCAQLPGSVGEHLR